MVARRTLRPQIPNLRKSSLLSKKRNAGSMSRALQLRGRRMKTGKRHSLRSPKCSMQMENNSKLSARMA